MRILLCSLIGYLLGTLNPAAWVAKIKQTNLREKGTGNLGATNTLLVFGKGWGLFVMLFDITKGVIAVRLAQKLVPTLMIGGLLAGSFAVVGHVYPFQLQFKGGKGLAAFAGMVYGLDSRLFLLLALISITLMLIVNYSVAMPMSAGILFPILYGLKSRNWSVFLLSLAVSLLIIHKHFSNIARARSGEDIRVRDYIRNNLFRR